MTDGQGLATICDRHGRIIEILRNDFSLALKAGDRIDRMTDPDDRDKLDRLLATALSRQAAFDWMINVVFGETIETLHFGAVHANEHLIVIAARNRTRLAQLSDEVARSSSAYVERMRQVLRESARQLRGRADQDLHLYDELSRLNNELATAQRRLIKTNQRLLVANDELRAFYDALPVGVFRCSAGGSVGQANVRFHSVTGVQSGQSWLKRVHPDDQNQVDRKWTGAVERAEPFASCHRIVAADGTERQVEIAVVRLAQEGRDPGDFIGVVEDVTDRIHAEEQARMLEGQHVLQQLTAGLAHNLNNLLTVILGSAEQVVMDVPPDHPAHAAALAGLTASERAAALTRCLTVYAGQGIQGVEPINVDQAVADACERVKTDPTFDGEITVRADADGVRIAVDATTFRETVAELLANARAAITDGGVIEVSTATQADEPEPSGQIVLITVRDTGVGMDAATLRRARDPFFTTREIGSGVGLGLSLADGFARLMGGALTIESAPGQGTCVELRIPIDLTTDA
jgi:PAS domain S-box-containing protein